MLASRGVSRTSTQTLPAASSSRQHFLLPLSLWVINSRWVKRQRLKDKGLTSQLDPYGPSTPSQPPAWVPLRSNQIEPISPREGPMGYVATAEVEGSGLAGPVAFVMEVTTM